LKTSDHDLLILSDDCEGVHSRERVLEPSIAADIICLTHGEFRRRCLELSMIGVASK